MIGHMSTWTPDVWHEAWSFAAQAHHGQRFPGSELPYLVHIGAVAMEVSHAIARRAAIGSPVAAPDLAITCALLHDVVEDTSIELEQIAARFGQAVADGVSALTKREAVGDKPAQMRDSLDRIRSQPREIWLVKLADRITNLQAPPHYWDVDKIRHYQAEARDIHAALASACPVLGPRLAAKIDAYSRYAS